MRPGQNKRMRGRNNGGGGNNRKGPNPLTRSYESNGPDVKIRGTAHHVGEKYLQLARDAQSSGDPVMAESYLQHAEHYFRLIAAAQQAQAQAAYGYQRPAGEQAEADDDDGDDDFSSLPDRFASPAERVVTPPPQPAPQPYVERPAYNGGGERYDRPNQPNGERGDRYQQDRPAQQYGDRQGQQGEGRYDRQDRRNDRQPYGERNFNRQDRPSYQDRQNQDRQNQHQDRQPQDRQGQDRQGQERQPQDRQGQDRQPQDRQPQDRQGQDRQPQDRQPQERPAAATEAAAPERGANRDYDNRGPRNGNRFRDQPREAREPRQPPEEPAANALPAFITAPVRLQPETAAPVIEPVAAASDASSSPATDEAGFALRPRRRRRVKAEFAEAGGGEMEAPASDPVGE